MAIGPEILTKIKSIENTKKITKVMEMVARSKMYRTQEKMKMARPYAEVILDVISHLATSNMQDIQESNILIKNKDITKKVGFIFITTDKGLCGGLNHNVTKVFLSKVKALEERSIESKIVCLGSKGLSICKSIGLNVIASSVSLGDSAKLSLILGSINVIFDEYFNQQVDAIYMIYSKFINTMKQEPSILTLLPINESILESKNNYNWDYIYEPNNIQVLDFLIKRYLESEVYRALCDNMACEQSARMVAMQTATDNANNAIKELRLVYNKSRQAAITKELSEIVAGSDAV